MRASNAIVTTLASSRVYKPTISPGSTTRPVSSSVSRIAASWTVSSISRNPPGCAQDPLPGSIPRRMRTISPASVIGNVVTTRRGLTYRMWPQTVHERRSRSSPATAPNASRAPQREQKLRDSAIQRGTPAPEGRSVERPSGPRSCGLSVTTGRSREDDDERGCDERGKTDQAYGDPGEPEQPLGPVDRHPCPGRAPDPEHRVCSRDDEERRGDQHTQLDQGAADGRSHLKARDRDRAADEHDDTEVDVVLLEGSRLDFRHGPRREPLEARRQDRSADGLAVEDRHPGFPALVFHGPECSGGPGGSRPAG